MISKRTLILRMARVMAVFSFLALVSAGCANSESSSSNGGENGSGENGGGEGGEGGGGEGGGGEGGGNGGGNGGGGSHHGGGDGPGGGGNGGGEGGGEGGGGEGGGGEGGGGEGGGGEGGGSVCVNGAKDCSETDGIPLLCEDGSWVAQEACQGNLVCLAGDCIKGSSCASPIVLNVGETITGSTVGGESRRTGANCEYKYETPEAVVKVNVPETGYYQFAVESTTGGNWAYYASPVCDGDDMVWPLTADWCGGSAVSDNFRKLLPEGEFYIFFETKDGNESKFSVTFDRSADQQSYVCYNGREYPVTNPTLDLSSGKVTLTNQTTVGGENKQQFNAKSACKVSGTKAEAVYPFFLDREAQISAKLTNVKPAVEGKSYKAMIYIASCKENLGNLTINESGGNKNECTVSAQNAETSEHTSGLLPAGLYNLIVDSVDTGDHITFDLEVSIVGVTE